MHTDAEEQRYIPAESGLYAGGDLFMPGSKGDWKRCMEQLKSGVLSRRQLEINATRILHMARRLTREP